MSGLGGFQRNLGGFIVTHFADQNHLGRLAQCGAQGRRKVFRVMSDLALINGRVLVGVQVLDRIFDRHHVIVLRFVNDVDDCGERGTFAGTRRSRNEHQAVFQLGNICQLGRQSQSRQRRYVGRNNAHHDRIHTALLKNIAAKTGARRK